MMRGRTITVLTWFVTIAVCSPGPALADEPADEKARAADFLTIARRESESYSFRSDSSGVAIKLNSEPVLKWSNPLAGTIYGSVYLWTAGGRPEVVASIHKWYAPYKHQSHEFHSLSLGTFVAEREGNVVWTPSRPGVALQPLADAPAPAGSPAQRLRQMRDLAAKFTAREINRENVDRDMRLLTQPIYRYENTGGDLIDGAMFAFVQGTDPEAYLMIEDRRVDGAPQWQYALARMNSINLYVNYGGREVWNVPTIPYAALSNRRDPYTLFRFDPVEAAEKP